MAGRPRNMYYKVSNAFDVLRDAGGQLHTAAPDRYLRGAREDVIPDLWQSSLDAMMAACIETEKLLKMLAQKAGLPEPDSNLAKYANDLRTISCPESVSI